MKGTTYISTIGEMSTAMERLKDAELEAIVSPPRDMGLSTSEARIHNPYDRTNDGAVAILRIRDKIESDEINVILEGFNWKTWEIGMESKWKHFPI